MPRVFLSHSSRDKESYVRIVAEKLISALGVHNVVYDELTFEEGMKPIEEIERGLEVTDLFVIFLSNTALDSKWVNMELKEAHSRLSKSSLSRIYPIIIDKEITYEDIRIPDWMREEYNVKYISRPSKAVNMIRQRIIEISWQLHPRLKEKDKIFVGRNELIGTFEERIDDYTMEKPLCFIATGVESIGRQTLLKHCFIKANVFKRESYQPLIIELNSHQSIEDFIYALYGLGYSETVDIQNLMLTKIEDKVRMAIDLVSDIQVAEEKIFIRDDGCLVTFDGSISSWFLDIVNGLKHSNRVTFGVMAKFRVTMRELWKFERFFALEVVELEKKERDGLLNRYLEFESISLTGDDFRYFSNLQKGYPEQVYYTVSLIKNDGLEIAKKQSHEIINYSSEKVNKILQRYEDDDKALEFLYFLSLFDTISYNYIFIIVGDDSYYKEKLNEFLNISICTFIGTNKEYIKLNDAVKDYVLRLGVKLDKSFEAKLVQNLDEFLKTYSFEDFEIPDYLFTVKEALIRGMTIDERFLIPSHFLKTMTELYDVHNNYNDVIKFADKALENIDFMDSKIVFEIRYFLCLSLARLRNKRFLREVQYIDGAEHHFLLGYYYRLVGNNPKALEELTISIIKRPKFSRAKRELVQVYIQLEEYETAKQLAKDHYENDKSNPYHIQAYFTCLIKSDRSPLVRSILEELQTNLGRIKSKVAREMLLRCEALFLAYYKNDEVRSLLLIDRAIKEYPNHSYAIYNKFEICERFQLIDEMELIIKHLEESKKVRKNDYNYNSFIKAKTILIAMKEDLTTAKKFLKENASVLPESVFNKLLSRLENMDSDGAETAV